MYYNLTKSATLLHNPADKTMRLEMHLIDTEYIQDETVNRRNKIIMNKLHENDKIFHLHRLELGDNCIVF